jgi:hypothetical protein
MTDLDWPVIDRNPRVPDLGGVSSLLRKNISVRARPKSLLHPRRLVPLEGRIAIVTDAGRDAVDAGGASDEGANCGRRSRVVLTPRRWRQVGGRRCRPYRARHADIRWRRWQTSPVTGESAKETVKTIACGNAGCSGGPVATTSCATNTLHTRLRVRRAPGIPHALYFGANDSGTTRARRAARGRRCVCWLFEIRIRCRANTPRYSSSLRTQGPITTGHSGCAKVVEQRLSK